MTRLTLRALILSIGLALGLAASALGFAFARPTFADLGSCAVWPPDNIWNTRIDGLSLHPNSDNYINHIGASAGLHADFGTVWNGAPNGIPYLVVPTNQPLVPVTMTPYGNEADPGPYPIPTNAVVEGGNASNGDRHLLIVRRGDCRLFELYRAFPNPDGSWRAYGANFDLNSNALRPADWTSADAAGLVIMPGLVKYQEVQDALNGDGVIHYALRFTVPPTSQPPLSNQLGGCTLFPSDSIFNTPIDQLPVDERSDNYIQSIGPDTGIHPDFGAGLWNGAPIGIPYNLVPKKQSLSPVRFLYQTESDPGPYPIPADPKIERETDRHLLTVQKKNCVLYELFAAKQKNNGKWKAGSGAIWNLNSNALRPSGWTSADAAGLPILPLLVRYDQVAAGEIHHALRFTARFTRGDYLWPARHEASDITDPNVPPMGQRFRLKAEYDISGFSPQTRVILRALKKYGMFLADNGSDWFVTGAPDEHWDNDVLVSELHRVKGSDFQAVDESHLMVDPDSGQAQQP